MLTVAGLSTRLERVEAILSTIISNSTRALTGDEPPGPPATLTDEATSEATSIIGESTDKLRGEEVVRLTETPPPPVAELTATLMDTPAPQTPARLPLKRIPALIRKAKKLSAQGVSWKAIARQWNDEGIPTRSGIGKWHGSTVAKLVGTE
jgi:hypothetical protein